MNAKEVLKTALISTKELLNAYLSDLSDDDLLVQPVPGANHIAWQLGHLISAEKHLLEKQLPGAVYPELPEGMGNQIMGSTATAEKPGGFTTRTNYLELFNKVRAATLANVEKLTEADLDKKNTNEVAAFAPTLGALVILIANHTLMHAGQFTVVRRLLKKPILF